jgi:epoxyqueuosine reductase
MTAADLRRRLQALGLDGAVVGIQHLPRLRQSFEALESGDMDSDFVKERLAFFDFRPPADPPGARSIIVTAMPLPVARVWFHWNGRRVAIPVPPGYIGFDRAGRMMQDLLAGILGEAGFRIAAVALPEKAVAAGAGLARYGANALAYVQGMGSLLRLVTFASDLPPDDPDWREAQALARCARCRSCAAACPTGAIDAGRFLLRAERCLVLHNERPSSIPFPDWIPQARHECLVGCMECQRACPENLPYLDRVVEAGEFSEAETVLILQGREQRNLPARLQARLQGADLLCQLHVLARNLRAVLAAAAA